MKTKEDFILNNKILHNLINYPMGKEIIKIMQEYADQEVNKVLANLNYTLD